MQVQFWTKFREINMCDKMRLIWKRYKNKKISHNIAHFWKQKNENDTKSTYHDGIRISYSLLQFSKSYTYFSEKCFFKKIQNVFSSRLASHRPCALFQDTKLWEKTLRKKSNAREVNILSSPLLGYSLPTGITPSPPFWSFSRDASPPLKKGVCVCAHYEKK